MMKTYKLLIMLALSISLFSCQHEDVLLNDTSQSLDNAKYKVKVINNMLYFETREDYQKTIDYLAQLGDENFANWENEISFKSLRSVYSEANLVKIGIEDNLFATLLNPERLIRIGDNIFKIDMKTETVLMTPSFLYSNKKNFSQNGVQKFSIEDDVLDILEGKEPDMIAKRRKRFCKTGKLSGSWREPNSGTNINYKVVYQKSGIYKSLQAKIKRTSSVGGLELVLRTNGNNFWKNKKKTRNIDNRLLDGVSREYNYRPYNRTRRLKDFRFGVEFEAISQSGWSAGKILILSCRR